MRIALLAGLLVATITAAAPAPAALIHDYRFDNGLGDSVAGGVALVPSISPGNGGNGTGTAAAGLYTFTEGGGLSLSSQLPGNVYTIELRVALDQVSGYRKLISFENITSDLGLYDLNGSLDLFNVAISPDATDFTPGVFTDVRISRDAAGLVTGYIGGVQKLSYLDTTGLFTAAGQLYFLRDDTAQNGEQSGGVADYIRIYDTAVPTAAAVPEPATWAMAIGGFGLIGGAMRRRRVTVAAFA